MAPGVAEARGKRRAGGSGASSGAAEPQREAGRWASSTGASPALCGIVRLPQLRLRAWPPWGRISGSSRGTLVVSAAVGSLCTSGLHSAKGLLRSGKAPRGGQQGWQRGWKARLRRGTSPLGCPGWRGDPEEGSAEAGTGLCSLGTAGGTHGNGPSCARGGSGWALGKFPYREGVGHWHRLPSEVLEAPRLSVFEAIGQRPH